VQDKFNLKTSVVGALANFKYAFGATLKEDQLRMALTTADNVTSLYSDAKSFVHCSSYDNNNNNNNNNHSL
jgi:hypothetical protein